MDAGRDEVYVREHDGSESCSHQEEFLAAARGRLTLTADQSITELTRTAGLKVEEIARPRTDAIARLGWKKIRPGQTISPEALDANYIRRSERDLFQKQLAICRKL